jgi:hypothetical protein
MGKRLPDESIEELREMSWGEYIKSRHWKRFSKILLDDPDCVCAICGKPRWNGRYTRGKKKGKLKRTCLFNTHHKNYDHLGEETKDDVLVLCHQCHEFCHDVEMMSRTRGGVFTEIYGLILKHTPWEYTPFKDRNKNNI